MTFLVPPWSVREAHTLHPVMTIGSTAAPSVALAAVADGLSSVGFRIRYAGPEHLTARLITWRFPGWRPTLSALVTEADVPLAMLTLEAHVTQQGVRVRVASKHGGSVGTRQASAGLSRTVSRLRQQGFEVSTTPWARR